MKTPAFVLILAVLGGIGAPGQETATNGIGGGIKGQATGQTQPPTVVAPLVVRTVVVQERQYYTGGLLADVARGDLLKRSPYAHPNSPVQNPSIDLVTGRPRGMVVFSLRY